MKNLVCTLAALILASAFAAAQQSPDVTKGIVASYLEIQTALASDRFEDVKAPAGTLAARAVTLGKEGEAIGKAATAVQAAADIKAAREAFGPLSDAVIARVQAEQSKGGATDLRLAYCPMARRAWLQREEQLRNPYFGAQMLTCGEFKPLAK